MTEQKGDTEMSQRALRDGKQRQRIIKTQKLEGGALRSWESNLWELDATQLYRCLRNLAGPCRAGTQASEEGAPADRAVLFEGQDEAGSTVWNTANWNQLLLQELTVTAGLENVTVTSLLGTGSKQRGTDHCFPSPGSSRSCDHYQWNLTKASQQTRNVVCRVSPRSRMGKVRWELTQNSFTTADQKSGPSPLPVEARQLTNSPEVPHPRTN